MDVQSTLLVIEQSSSFLDFLLVRQALAGSKSVVSTALDSVRLPIKDLDVHLLLGCTPSRKDRLPRVMAPHAGTAGLKVLLAGQSQKDLTEAQAFLSGEGAVVTTSFVKADLGTLLQSDAYDVAVVEVSR